MNIVIGGGIAGITSALLMAKKYGKVCIIERDNDLGGLYRSTTYNDNLTFDYGTHYLQMTGNDNANKMMFRDVDEDHWHILGNLKGGSFYANRLNSNSPFLDARGLSANLYQKGLSELLNITNDKNSFENAEDQLRNIYGDALTDHLFRPILEDKYYGASLHELLPGAQGLVGVGRILVATPEASRELKKSSIYDQKIGFHNYKEGQNKRKNFYPKQGGIQKWIDLLKTQLQELGVEVITGESVEHTESKNGSISSVTLSSGREVHCDRLIWTVPVPFFFKIAGLDAPENIQAPRKLYTSLFHFAFDKPFLTDVHFLQCHAPEMKTFRVTLYSNIQEDNNGMYRITSEVISPKHEDLDALKNKVQSELYEMGIVDPQSKVVFQKSVPLKNGFPLLTPEYLDSIDKQIQLVNNTFDNIYFFGRNSGINFRVDGILEDVHTAVEAME